MLGQGSFPAVHIHILRAASPSIGPRAKRPAVSRSHLYKMGHEVSRLWLGLMPIRPPVGPFFLILDLSVSIECGISRGCATVLENIIVSFWSTHFA